MVKWWGLSLSFVIYLVALTGTHAASPYVTLAQDSNGVWWFEHNGNYFITKGVNHVNNGGMDDGVGGRESAECHPLYPLCGDTLSFSSSLKYAPYYNTTIARYGTANVWANNTKNRLLEWGFNSMGGWTCTLMEQQGGVYYAHLLDIGTTWLRSNWLPDLFDPAFEQQCLQIAQQESFNSSAYGLAGATAYLQQKYTTLQALNTAWSIIRDGR